MSSEFLNRAVQAGLIHAQSAAQLASLPSPQLWQQLQVLSQQLPPEHRQLLAQLWQQSGGVHTPSGRLTRPATGVLARPSSQHFTSPAQSGPQHGPGSSGSSAQASPDSGLIAAASAQSAQSTILPAAVGNGAEDSDPSQLGPYVIERELGKGAMGAVYVARHAQLKHQVAIKLLRSKHTDNAEMLERFAIEGRSAARLRHKNVVGVHEVGESPFGPYLVMDYVAGETLGQRLKREGQVPPREAAEIAAALAEGLAHAHRQGVLHRDLKPDNVLLGDDGVARISDFGLAREMESSADHRMTQSGQLLGTPNYMSPEQAFGDVNRVDRASDIYNLGVVFYEMLTGQVPFENDDLRTLLIMIVGHDVPRPRKLNSEIDADLELIVLTCLAKEPHERSLNAQALADDLNRWLRGEALQIQPPGLGKRLWKWARRNPVLVTVLLTLLMGGAVSAFVGMGLHSAGLQRERDRALKAEREAAAQRDQAQASKREAESAREQVERALVEAKEAKARAEQALTRSQRLAAENADTLAQQFMNRADWRQGLSFAAKALTFGDSPRRRMVVRTARAQAWSVKDVTNSEDELVIRAGRWHSAGCAWSPDGRLIAYACYGASAGVRIVNVSSGQLVAWIKPKKRAPDDLVLAWSPDSRYLAMGESSGWIQWVSADGRVLKDFEAGRHMMSGLVWWSPELLQTHVSNLLCTWSLGEEKPVQAIRMDLRGAKMGTFCGPVWEPKSKTWATIAMPFLKGALRPRLFRSDYQSSLPIEASGISTLNWSPKGDVLALVTNRGRLLFVGKDRQVIESKRPSNRRRKITYTPRWSAEGRLAYSYGALVLVHDKPSEEPSRVLGFHRTPVTGLAWTLGGKQLVTVSSEQACLWTQDLRRPQVTLRPTQGAFLLAPVWMHGGRWLVLVSGRGLRIWDRVTFVTVARIDLQGMTVKELVPSPDGESLAVVGQQRVFLVRPPKPNPRMFEGTASDDRMGQSYYVDWSNDGRLVGVVSKTQDKDVGRASAFDSHTGKWLWSQRFQCNPEAMRLMFAQGYAYVSSNGGVGLIDERSGEFKRKIQTKLSVHRFYTDAKAQQVTMLGPQLQKTSRVAIVNLSVRKDTQKPALAPGLQWVTMAYGPDGQLYGVTSKSRVVNVAILCRIDPQSGKVTVLANIDKFGSIFCEIAVSKKGLIALGVRPLGKGASSKVFLVDPKGQLLKTIAFPGASWKQLHWHTDDEFRWGRDGVTSFCSISTGRIRELGVSRPFWAWSPNRKYYATVDRSQLEIWSSKGDLLLKLNSAGSHLRWSPRGDRLVLWSRSQRGMTFVSVRPESGEPKAIARDAEGYLSLSFAASSD